MPTVLKSGSRNLLEPSGPVQACNRIALPLLSFTFYNLFFDVNIPCNVYNTTFRWVFYTGLSIGIFIYLLIYHLLTYLFIYLFTYLFIYLFIYLLFIYLLIYLLTYVCIYLVKLHAILFLIKRGFLQNGKFVSSFTNNFLFNKHSFDLPAVLSITEKFHPIT